MYYIYDELGELMRKVRHKCEAQQIVSIRNGWSYVFVKTKKKSFKSYNFAAAPF